MVVIGAMGLLVAGVAASPPQPAAAISMAALLNTTIAVRALDIIKFPFFGYHIVSHTPFLRT